MNAQELALILLLLRIVATTLLTASVLKQTRLIRTTTTDYPKVRWGVYAASIVLLVGQFIPILLDTVVAFGQLYAGRNPNPEILGTSYALNNALKDVAVGALLIIQYYRPRRTPGI